MNIVIYIGITMLMCVMSAVGAITWTKNSISASIKGSEDNLSELSLLFLSMDGPMKRLAYEFKAMAELYKEKEAMVWTSEKRQRGQQQAANAASYSGSSERCGDNYLYVNLPDGRFALALSDGMGKGEAAACESGIAVTSVIKMLQAGLDTELVLRLLNTILMSDTTRERFPTMDLGIYEPDSGEIHFYKIGAAPTVIRRKASVSIEIFSSPAMPMGIAEPEGLHPVSTIVRPGDQIIMMSDGVADSVRGDTELKWLQNLVANIRSRNPQTVCDLIIREASINYGFREKDDMLVTVFNIV